MTEVIGRNTAIQIAQNSTDTVVIKGAVQLTGAVELDGAINHDGSTAGFYGTTPIARPSVTWPNTATATTALNELKANRLMAALVALGLIVTT